MKYTIVAIPTRYNSSMFRSRLEARWAAFFDLCNWRWDYEPIDLKGWAPDFRIATPFCPVFVEVKPVDPDAKRHEAFTKAFNHFQSVQVLLLGVGPVLSYPHSIGLLLDPPEGTDYYWADVHEFLRPSDMEGLWREAGNVVQWLPRR